jgi:hypothetical protein
MGGFLFQLGRGTNGGCATEQVNRLAQREAVAQAFASALIRLAYLLSVGMHPLQLQHLIEGVFRDDPFPVHFHDEVARLETGALCG